MKLTRELQMLLTGRRHLAGFIAAKMIPSSIFLSKMPLEGDSRFNIVYMESAKPREPVSFHLGFTAITEKINTEELKKTNTQQGLVL